ncbi:MAG: metallophosphoesterase [Candidatus Cloacimonetes bacterium]|nr:metallophosphoesterase [Candidatus Cloacimonadota bacterium]
MKVFASSDIHFDHNPANQKVWELLHKKCLTQKPEVLIICGDLAESLSAFDQSLSLFKDLNCHKLFVPGNHDLWNRVDTKSNATQKLEVDLPKICNNNNWHYLPSNPLQIENWTFVGSPFWYDYSLMPKDHPFSVEDFQKKSYQGRTWQDSNFVRFTQFKDDFEVCKHFYNQLKSDLKLAKTKQIFCASHFPCHHEIFNFTGKNWPLEYFGAYMGSNRYQELLEQYKVSILLSGHVHRKFDETINDMRVILNPLGYLGEWKSNDPHSEIDFAIKQLII